MSGKHHKNRKRHPWKPDLNQRTQRHGGKRTERFDPSATGKRLPNNGSGEPK